jgi:pullulanase
MGCHDIETMNAIRAELNQLNPSILIYGEGWSAGDDKEDRETDPDW